MAKKKKTTKKKTTKKKVTKKKTTKKKTTKKKVTKKKTTKKKTTKKKVTKKKTTKKKTKTRKKRKPNPAFMKPMVPSDALAVVVGSKPLPRPQVIKKMWEYIKGNDLQDPKNRRNINADSNLKKVFGKNQVTMFQMNKLLNKHLT